MMQNNNSFAKQQADSFFVPSLDECIRLLGLSSYKVEALPFVTGDTTAGMENELQVAVEGHHDAVDLPRYIKNSNYYSNIIRRTLTGDAPPHARRNLERYLENNSDQVWENSWVRFPVRLLSAEAQKVLSHDLSEDKDNPGSLPRGDMEKFFLHERGERYLRIPISYLLKLSLADALYREDSGQLARGVGLRLLGHFLSDNTSPETYSFYVVGYRKTGQPGRSLAREALKRYLLTQLLLEYANKKFALEESGQKALLFFSPHPPIRQRSLNECISDAFYRELFMSPCLSGWSQGEKKYRYMVLCHQVLSRSHLNAVMKIREAGINITNLVLLPHTSNISLANNGTHISLGSLKLTNFMRDPRSGFNRRHEKYLGDLVAKIMEHFLPLFVGTYSAAPYRLDFKDFHPERVLGFLPHELDYTHLRMIWRRWKKKAKNNIFGQAVTPFGPEPVDSLLGKVFSLRGDFVPDFRLVDYPVAFLSTEKNCYQDGQVGNDIRLKDDLDSLGVFDKRMSLYQLYKLREFDTMGFSGFEARYYSLFESIDEDVSRATELQMLLSALAYKYILSRECSHEAIPSNPFTESERRQILFGTSIGIPTFFVRKDTSNKLLLKIVKRTANTRPSRRYKGYVRVLNHEYRLALLKVIREDAADLIELLGLEETLADLERRVQQPDEFSTCGKLVKGILGRGGKATTPYKTGAADFNQEAERYYREELRRKHLEEAWRFFAEDAEAIAEGKLPLSLGFRREFKKILAGENIRPFLGKARKELFSGSVPLDVTKKLIALLLLSVDVEAKREKQAFKKGRC